MAIENELETEFSPLQLRIQRALPWCAIALVIALCMYTALVIPDLLAGDATITTLVVVAWALLLSAVARYIYLRRRDVT